MCPAVLSCRNEIILHFSRVRQTSEEGRMTYRPKCCGNNNKDEDNSPKTLNECFCLFLMDFSPDISFCNIFYLQIVASGIFHTVRIIE